MLYGQCRSTTCLLLGAYTPKLVFDNTCAVSYIKHMGRSHSQACNEIAQKIWIWCQERNVHLTITYLPGKLNTDADEQLRKFNEQTEWKLNPKVKKKKNGSKSIPFDQL